MMLEQLELNKVYHWPQQGEWTYDDYAHLPDGEERYEVIKGAVYQLQSELLPGLMINIDEAIPSWGKQ